MSNANDISVRQSAPGCPPARPRRRWAASIAVAALVALAVTFIEVRLIEQSATASVVCGRGVACGIVRGVESSLAGAFAPIATLR